jgi:CubicO group peptidase (beta-lactamase class C family)
MGTLFRDFRYALRQFRKAPDFTLTVVRDLDSSEFSNLVLEEIVHVAKTAVAFLKGNRRRFEIALSSILLITAFPKASCLPSSQRTEAKREIDSFMRTLSSRGQFNGAILVADADGVLYEAAFGQADRSKGIKFTTETQSCLASVSKPFTALAVMMLAQNGSLRLDDPVSNYVEGLQIPLGAVTIRELLTHTSGVPDYSDLGIEHAGLTSDEVLQALRRLDRTEFSPGERYRYSNSGYVLLGAVIARVSGIPLPQFLDSHVFTPVGMRRTFVFTHKGQETLEMARGYDAFGSPDDYAEFVTGDGGMYSTVDDLWKFDLALFNGKLISQKNLNEMFTPGSVRTGKTTYGLGWNIDDLGPGKRAWHTGNTAGFRAYIEHQFSNNRVTIMLTNIGNSKRVEISAAINNIIDGKIYTSPKRPASVEMENVYRSSGIDAAIRTYRRLKAQSESEYDLSEGELNSLGYQILYADHHAQDAIKAFALNAEEHPTSSNAFDSLAEAYRVGGNTQAASANYEKALVLDPTNEHARTALSQIK